MLDLYYNIYILLHHRLIIQLMPMQFLHRIFYSINQIKMTRSKESWIWPINKDSLRKRYATHTKEKIAQQRLISCEIKDCFIIHEIKTAAGNQRFNSPHQSKHCPRKQCDWIWFTKSKNCSTKPNRHVAQPVVRKIILSNSSCLIPKLVHVDFLHWCKQCSHPIKDCSRIWI